MKKIISLLVAVLVCAGPMSACKKKAAVPASELTIIVMDTTQALLPDAEVKAGKKVFVTSFDGRVVLKKEQIGKGTFTVSCDGYKEKTVTASNDDVLLVRLSAKPGRKNKDHVPDVYMSLGSGRSYREAAVSKEMAVPSPGFAVEPAIMTDYVAVEEDAAPAEMVERHKGGSAANNVSAGKLTAGEVNDFAKWYFWPNILDGSHKWHAVSWKVVPRQRFTVQVTNTSGFPVVARAVSLLDGQGNTHFQAVTDNTG